MWFEIINFYIESIHSMLNTIEATGVFSRDRLDIDSDILTVEDIELASHLFYEIFRFLPSLNYHLDANILQMLNIAERLSAILIDPAGILRNEGTVAYGDLDSAISRPFRIPEAPLERRRVQAFLFNVLRAKYEFCMDRVEMAEGFERRGNGYLAHCQ
jgi:hypothetical protein